MVTATIEEPSATDLETTAARLSDAGRDFGEARAALGAWWALPARAVPVVAQHWRVGNYGEITADDGRLRLTRFGRQDELTSTEGLQSALRGSTWASVAST